MPSIRTSLSLAALLASTTFVQAVEPLPYEANFERSGGFELGGLDGQRGWSVEEGSAVITDGEGREGSRALRLEPSDPVGSVGLTVATGERGNILYSDLYLRPGATNPEAGAVVGAESSFTGFFRIEAGGELYIFNGNGQGGGNWLATGAKFATQEDGSVQDWIRLSFRQDFDQKVWDLFINGKIFRTNLGFWKDAEVAPQEARFTLTGHTAVPLWVDDLKIDSDSVAFVDADRDGLPDEWEIAQGLDATVANRDEDADSDGLTNAEELVVGTSAKVADTDGDGMNDGDEVAARGNPTRKDRWPRLGLTGVAAAETLQHRLVLSVPFVSQGEATDEDVSMVLDALDTHLSESDAGRVEPLEKFSRDEAHSPLRLWVEAHAARLAIRHCRFGTALPLLERVWGQRPADAPATPEEAGLFGIIGADLAGLYAVQGETDRMGDVLDSLLRNPLPGGLAEVVYRLQSTHWTQKHQPALTQRCGAFALHALARQFDPITAQRVAEKYLAPNGKPPAPSRTLAQVAKLAGTEGLDLRLMQRPVGAEFVIPSLVHLRIGHFAVLTALTDDGSFILDDPARGVRCHITPAALDEELSGACLVPAQSHLPESWSELSTEAAESFIGHSGVSGQVPDDPCAGVECGSCGSPGVASASLNAFRASLVVSDTSMFDLTTRGPALNVTATWSQHSVSGLSLLNYTKLGSGANWSLGDMPYVDEYTGSPDRRVFQGGNLSVHVWNSATYSFDRHILTQQRLEKIYGSGGFQGFRLRSSDNSYLEFFTYGKEAHSNVEHRRWLLTKTVDAQGNAVTITYDNDKRILNITGPPGAASLAFSYVGGSYWYNIASISDTRGTGRNVQFGYDGWNRLQSITDVEGIISSFGYNGSRLNTLTTPNGMSTFSLTVLNNNYSFGRYVDATDPRGWTERVLYANQIPQTWIYEYVDPVNMETVQETRTTVAGTVVEPNGTSHVLASNETTGQALAANQFLYQGCTLYWDKKAFHYFNPGDPTGGNFQHADKARHTHWMYSGNGFLVTGVPASTRNAEAAGYRTFHIYKDQSTPGWLSGSALNITTVQRVRDETLALVDRTTSTEYNSLGHVTQVTEPVGRKTQYEYATNGIDLRFVRQQEGVGVWKVMSERIYGGTGAIPHKPTTIKNASGDASTYEYNSYGQLKLEINAKGEKTRTNYDANGFLTSIEKTDPANPSANPPIWVTIYTVNSRDAFKNVATATDGDGYVTTYLYDKLNRLTKTTHPDGSYEERFYTDNGSPEKKIFEVGRIRDRGGNVKRYFYNGNRQLRLVRNALGNEIQYEYCRCGHLKSIVDERGKETKWKFDLNGRTIEKIYHDQKSTVYTYQLESGLLSTVKLAKDTVATFTQTYYRDGSLYKIDYSDAGTPDVFYYYDTWYNRLTYRTDGVGTTNYTYKPTSTAPAHPGTGNGAGQLTSVDGPWSDDTITYTYDDLGRLTSRSLYTASYSAHSHSNSLTFDSLGRLTQDANGLDTYTYTYIGNSRLIDKRTSAGGIGVQGVDYDYFLTTQGRFLQRISHKTSTGGTVISQHDYTYGTGTEHGQIKTWQRLLPNNGGGHTTTTQTFGYDLTYQIKSAAETGQSTRFYNYDLAGNRTSKSENNTTTNYTQANSLNQIPSATGGHAYTSASYDDNGNLTAMVYPGDSRRLMVWDGINRLKQLTIQAGINPASGDKRVLWTYNAYSQRSSETHQTFNGTSWGTNNTFYFIWEGGHIVQKRDNGTSAYICTNYFPEGEIRCYAGTTTRFYHTRDHLGSVYEMTNTSGTVQIAYSFTPCGERSYRWGSLATDIAYTGHWYLKPSTASHPAAAELSLTWFRAYDPRRGVWLSRDPIGEVDGTHLYNYVSNNSIARADRNGLFGQVVGPFVGALGIMALCTVDIYLNTLENHGHRSDDFRHCITSCKVAKRCGATVSVIAQLWKEFNDLIHHNDHWQDHWDDMFANNTSVPAESFYGGALGGWIGSCFRESCEDCCNRHFP